MQTWITIIIAILIFRGIGIVLRKSQVGSTLITIAGKLFWLFPLGILGSIMGNTYFAMFSLFSLFIFLRLPVSIMLQSMYQLAAMIAPLVSYKFKLPSKENYEPKGSYILPFVGKWTVVNGGTTKELSHSWGMLSQRYAYDFIIIDDNGNSFLEDSRDVQNYHCYGVDIVAPADGVVIDLRKKYKDSYVDGRSIYCDASHIAGNFVVIQHNNDEYSLIAHLMPDSISVGVGDTVKQGQVIAKCGNTGNSSQPHVHFQLQSGKSFFTSVGLPIGFSNIHAQDKKNYSMIDPRPFKDNLQHEGNTVYIGRGLEVENMVN